MVVCLDVHEGVVAVCSNWSDIINNKQGVKMKNLGNVVFKKKFDSQERIDEVKTFLRIQGIAVENCDDLDFSQFQIDVAKMFFCYEGDEFNREIYGYKTSKRNNDEFPNCEPVVYFSWHD